MSQMNFDFQSACDMVFCIKPSFQAVLHDFACPEETAHARQRHRAVWSLLRPAKPLTPLLSLRNQSLHNNVREQRR